MAEQERARYDVKSNFTSLLSSILRKRLSRATKEARLTALKPFELGPVPGP